MSLRAAASMAARGTKRWRAVALDMDGTTLNHRLELTTRTLNALRRVDAAGVQVIIATGRPTQSLQPYIDQMALPNQVLTVCFNGGCASLMSANAPEQTQVLFDQGLDVNLCHQILDLCDKEGLCATFSLPSGPTAAPKGQLHEELLSKFEGLEGVKQVRVPDLRQLLRDGTIPLKIVALCNEPDATASLAVLSMPKELAHIIAAEMHIEFLKPGVSKGQALARLCQIQNIDMADVMAFGDNHNDKEMLRLVGQGVAMKNAKDSTKEVADRICEWTNDEQGIAQELETLLATHGTV